MIAQSKTFTSITLKSQYNRFYFFKTFNTVVVVILILVPCTLKAQQGINIGLVNQDEYHTLYNLTWFSNKYLGYSSTISSDKKLSKDLMQSEFIVFMGTWCHDSKIFIPKLFKLLDDLGVKNDQITIFNVDKEKKAPKASIKKYGIQYLPTVIFMKDNIEIGRIVEFPFSSLEEDISTIYNKTKESTEK